MESSAFENDAAACSDQPADFAPALWTFLQEFVGHLLELLKLPAAGKTFIFIGGHLSFLHLICLCIGFTCWAESFNSLYRVCKPTVRPPSRTNAERAHLAERRQHAGHL